jgi:hypothetical protein
MPFQQTLKITLERYHINSNRRTFDTSKLAFRFTVGTTVMDNFTAPFRVKTKSSGRFPGTWYIEVTFDIALNQHIDVLVEAFDVHKNNARDDLGTMTLRLWEPSITRAVENGTLNLTRMSGKKVKNHVDVEYRVEYQSEDGTWGRVVPESVFACRTQVGGTSYTTVGGGDAMRVEVSPVRPFFGDPEMTPRKRPVLLAGNGWRNYDGAGWIKATDPLNVVPNPSVIPIIASGAVTATNAARIEVTYYHPDTLNFTDDDARLEWTATGGGAVRFYNGAPDQPKGYGKKVMVYGVTEGEVVLEVRYKAHPTSMLVAKYRALVKRVGQVRYRVNLCYAQGDFMGTGMTVRIPMTLPAQVNNHLAVTNRILRQAAIELVPDDNTTTSDGATATVVAGVFEIDLSTRIGLIRNAQLAGNPVAAFNKRDGVVNICYLHTPVDAGTKGIASDFPDSGHGASTITDNGSPSHSWRSPTGVLPDDPATPQTMGIYHPGQTTRPPLAALLIFDICGWYEENTSNPRVVLSQVAKDYLRLCKAQHFLGEIATFDEFQLCHSQAWSQQQWEDARRDVQTNTPPLTLLGRFLINQHLEDVDDFGTFGLRLFRSRRGVTAWKKVDWEKARSETVVAPSLISGPTGVVGGLSFGQNIAHELGHALNLRHRHESGDDGVLFPPRQNLMTYGGPEVSQNIDILQAKVMHLSPLVSYP